MSSEPSHIQEYTCTALAMRQSGCQKEKVKACERVAWWILDVGRYLPLPVRGPNAQQVSLKEPASHWDTEWHAQPPVVEEKGQRSSHNASDLYHHHHHQHKAWLGIPQVLNKYNIYTVNACTVTMQIHCKYPTVMGMVSDPSVTSTLKLLQIKESH